MSKFLVVEVALVVSDCDMELSAEAAITAVYPADDTRGVAAAIRRVREEGTSSCGQGPDWTVWELSSVQGRPEYVQRAFIFKMDGRMPYDVQIVR